MLDKKLNKRIIKYIIWKTNQESKTKKNNNNISITDNNQDDTGQDNTAQNNTTQDNTTHVNTAQVNITKKTDIWDSTKKTEDVNNRKNEKLIDEKKKQLEQYDKKNKKTKLQLLLQKCKNFFKKWLKKLEKEL